MCDDYCRNCLNACFFLVSYRDKSNGLVPRQFRVSLGKFGMCSVVCLLSLIFSHCRYTTFQAITGESILSRCERIRNSLNQSLCQIQNLVPPLVGAKVSSQFICFMSSVLTFQDLIFLSSLIYRLLKFLIIFETRSLSLIRQKRRLEKPFSNCSVRPIRAKSTNSRHSKL